MQFFDNNTFTRINYTEEQLPKGEYDNCSFTDCTFSNADLSNITFTECVFEGCDLSMAATKNTSFKDVTFINCKMLGFNFNYCNPFLLAVTLDECLLDLASFYGLKLKNTRFKKCSLKETDFTEADLTGASFDGSDLSQAIFHTTILEKADLRNALNYSIDPEVNRIKKAKFSLQGLPGLLDKYSIEIE